MIFKVEKVEIKEGYTRIYFKTLEDLKHFYPPITMYSNGSSLKMTFEDYIFLSDGVHIYGFDGSFVYIAPTENKEVK